MANEMVSQKVILQRIRNRIIEYLEITSSVHEQRKVEPNELINMWEDWVCEKRVSTYSEPVFSKLEQQALSEFNSTWNHVVDSTPDTLPTYEVLEKNKYWNKLALEALKTLSVFMERGKLPEDVEAI